MNEKIIALDPLFNFGQAYKRNYCTLINFKIIEVPREQSFMVDGKSKTISYPKKLLQVVYREWRNQNWFKLEGGDDKKDYYWTSHRGAIGWLGETVKLQGLEKLSTEKAFEVAQLNLNL